MKNCILTALALALSVFTYPQKQSITWGEEFKLRKGSGEIEVLCSDETGVYVKEKHMALAAYYVVGVSFREAASLVKLNHRLEPLYSSNFNKELKGKSYENFVYFKKKLFLVASEYNRGSKTFSLQVAEINKNSGQLSGKWTELAAMPKDEKRDEISFKLFPNEDSSKLVLISTNTGREKNSYQIQEFDDDLKPSSAEAKVSNEFERNKFQLEDVIYTKEKKIILVGRVFEYETGKKKKQKFLDFSHYTIRVYDEQGAQVSELNTQIDGKWISSSKLITTPKNELLLAAFYSKEKRGKTSGLFVQYIDKSTGKSIASAEQEFTHAVISVDGAEGDDIEDGESKAERKERARLAKLQNEGEGFSQYMNVRNIFFTADEGLVLLAENYAAFPFSGGGGSAASGSTPAQSYGYAGVMYECKEIVVCKLDKEKKITWLQVLPKHQRETAAQTSSSTHHGGGPGVYSGGSIHNNFANFFFVDGRPFYAGFLAFPYKNDIMLYFNDHRRNADVTNGGQKVTKINKYSKSDCYVITLDVITGKMKRKVMFANDDQPTAMPRNGSVIGKDVFLVGRTDRTFGKTKLAVGRITTR